MSQEMSPYNMILASLQELESACRDLKKENETLKSKVSRLEASLNETKSDAAVESASLMSNNDRITVRNQIQTYIKRIDEILEESA